MFNVEETRKTSQRLSKLDGKLAGYLAAAGAIGAAYGRETQAAIVANTTVQPFGINGEVNIDFNSDGQTDFQIDHDRVNLNGTDLDYLQVDKNDVSSAANPLPVDNFATFPTNGTNVNGDTQYLSFTNGFGDQGGYAVGLKAGDMIGATGANSLTPGTLWDFQEGANFLGLGTTIRANRLIDEDHGQIDAALAGSQVTVPFGPQEDFPALDDFTGINGEVRYLGVRVDLNDAAHAGLNAGNAANQWWYGWIGIRIDNEADATGAVTGWAYESTQGMSIAAGDVGPVTGVSGDYNGDDVVDAADYTIWRNHLGQSFTLDHENPAASTPGLVDAEDYDFWKSQFGMTSGSGAGAGSVAVPEPASIAMAAIGGAFLLGGFAVRKLFGGNKK